MATSHTENFYPRFSEVPGKGICVAERSLLIRVGAASNIHSRLLGRKVRDLVGVASERHRRPLLSDQHFLLRRAPTPALRVGGEVPTLRRNRDRGGLQRRFSKSAGYIQPSPPRVRTAGLDWPPPTPETPPTCGGKGSLPSQTNKLSPPASGVTENSGDRENVLPKSGRLRTPGSRGAGARWRPQPNAAPRGRLQAPARPWSPPAASPRASAGRVLPLPAREGRIPPHDLWARPADPLPTRSEKRPLCVTKFGKNMDPSQSFHVCSQLPAEKAKGSLPEQTNIDSFAMVYCEESEILGWSNSKNDLQMKIIIISIYFLITKHEKGLKIKWALYYISYSSVWYLAACFGALSHVATFIKSVSSCQPSSCSTCILCLSSFLASVACFAALKTAWRTSLAIKGTSQPRAEQEKARFQRKELFTIKANWVPHRHGILYTKTELCILLHRLIPSLVKLKLNVAAINTRLPPGFHPTRRREFKPQEDQECPSPSLLEYPRWNSSSHIKEDSQGSGCENCVSDSQPCNVMVVTLMLCASWLHSRFQDGFLDPRETDLRSW
ncbi:uncharacterized protein LOC122422169 [Cervus canadensis]|uniref:uncharacterized protein LOC122422169 n=1 Tax=Cervus canadensis TaxID=1574408 RepID=UPI001CA334F6|nr:uncharacterized protein LOC122422169 [Cervus canadensis]